MKKLVILTGAGMSAESGIRTFRDMGGLWEQYDVMEVASPQGWEQNRDLVLRFYNERRRQLEGCLPNAGHLGLVDLEKEFAVQIITQNVDNLHERAGSSQVLHLHGLLTQARSTADSQMVYDIGYRDILEGDLCEKGSQLRPNIVWFGEAVPAIHEAVKLVRQADIFAVIGTSLSVYPAAGLLDEAPPKCPIFIVDPNDVLVATLNDFEFIDEKASTGVAKLGEMLRDYR
jgi:NAD-dependent deacetylase